MSQPFNIDAQVVLKQARRLAESSDDLVILPMHVLHALITDAPAVWNHLTDVDMHSLVGAVPAFQIRPMDTLRQRAQRSQTALSACWHMRWKSGSEHELGKFHPSLCKSTSEAS